MNTLSPFQEPCKKVTKIIITPSIEITSLFKSKTHLYHIYYTLNLQEQKFDIFIRLHRNTSINHQPIHHFFNITITSSFPLTFPYITCLSNLFTPSLNDQRNLLDCIHPDWKATSKISTLISNIPTFFHICNNDFLNEIFIFYGNYHLNDYQYSINDFLINPSNKIYRVKVVINDSITIIDEYYLILTDCRMLLFEMNPHDKSKGVIALEANIRAIINWKTMKINKEDKNKIGFYFEWDETIEKCDYGFIIDNNELNQDLHKEIMKRRMYIINKFPLIYDNEANSDLNTLEGIIKIKEIAIEKQFDNYSFHLLVELYQKIIDYYTMTNKDLLNCYVDKLQGLMKKFHDFNKIT